MPAQVSCPVCSNAVAWTAASRWRPFCSERCKLIDLGDWAADRHVIAGKSSETSGDSADPLPSEAEDPRH